MSEKDVPYKKIKEKLSKHLKKIKEGKMTLNDLEEKFKNLAFYKPKLINPENDSKMTAKLYHNDTDLLAFSDVYNENGFLATFTTRSDGGDDIVPIIYNLSLKNFEITKEKDGVTLTDEEFELLNYIYNKYKEYQKKIEEGTFKGAENLINLSNMKTILAPKNNDIVALIPVVSPVLIYKMHKEIKNRFKEFPKNKRTTIFTGSNYQNLDYFVLYTSKGNGLKMEFSSELDYYYLFINNPELFFKKVIEKVKKLKIYQKFEKNKSIFGNQENFLRKQRKILIRNLETLIKFTHNIVFEKIKDELNNEDNISKSLEKVLEKEKKFFFILNNFKGNTIIDKNLDKKIELDFNNRLRIKILKQIKRNQK